jgi:hypothetical protein
VHLGVPLRPGGLVACAQVGPLDVVTHGQRCEHAAQPLLGHELERGGRPRRRLGLPTRLAHQTTI